jgi:hypothetical protein
MNEINFDALIAVTGGRAPTDGGHYLDTSYQAHPSFMEQVRDSTAGGFVLGLGTGGVAGAVAGAPFLGVGAIPGAYIGAGLGAIGGAATGAVVGTEVGIANKLGLFKSS